MNEVQCACYRGRLYCTIILATIHVESCSGKFCFQASMEYQGLDLPSCLKQQLKGWKYIKQGFCRHWSIGNRCRKGNNLCECSLPQFTASREFLGSDAGRKNQKEPVGSLSWSDRVKKLGRAEYWRKKSCTEPHREVIWKTTEIWRNHQERTIRKDQSESYRKIIQSQEYHLKQHKKLKHLYTNVKEYIQNLHAVNYKKY